MSELRYTFDWNCVKNNFKEEFGETLYNAWLSSINIVSLNDFEIVLSVPTTFIKEWITRDFLNGKYKVINGNRVCIKKGIKEILKEYCPTLTSFNIIVDKKLVEELPIENNVKSISEEDNIYNIGTVLNKNYTFDNFIVGSSNKLAFKVANNIAKNEEIDNYTNPFFIYGNAGLGKTHLCQAIAWEKQKQNKKVIYLTAEKFMFLFVQSLQNQDINVFKNRLRNIDILIIDDIQFILGKDKTQKEFFYTFETLINDNKQIVLACDRSPSHLEELDEKLKSRINGGLIVDIKEPDYELRCNIIKNKSKILNLNLTADLIDYIANNVNSSGREIEGFLKRLKVNQDIMDIKITKNEIDNLLGDFISKKTININIIQDKVANYFNISLNDLKSEKRNKELVLPRHVAMYLSKKLTNKSFPDIARSFNGKNHATIIHAVNKIEKTINNDTSLLEIIDNITESFK